MPINNNKVDAYARKLAAQGASFVSPTGSGLMVSSGTIIKPTITYNIGGTVTIGSGGTYRFYHTTNYFGEITEHTMTGTTLNIPDQITSYIVADYNSGNPQYFVTTDLSTINFSSKTVVYTCSRVGDTNVDFLDWDEPSIGLSNKILRRDMECRRFERVTGLNLSEETGRKIVISAGVVWQGSFRNSLVEVNSSINDCVQVTTDVNGNWEITPVTTYNNFQYNNGNGVSTLTDGNYAVNWIYRGMGINANSIIIYLGTGDYDLNEAKTAQPPNVALITSTNAMLIGKIIVLKGELVVTQIDSTFVTQFTPSTTTSHEGLTGLEGGDENYHYHSDQPINTTNDVQFNSVTANTFIGISPYKYLYVGKNGNDDSGDGGIGNPFLTVQKAIDMAISGTTIFIWPGSYNENITLKAGVNLTASARYAVYISGNVTSAFTGTVIIENIVLNSSTGTTLTFSGTGAQNLQFIGSDINSTSGDAINWTNTNSSSKIQIIDGNSSVSNSSSTARCFYSTTGAAGSLIANRATFKVNNPDNVVLAIGGAISFNHTSDQVIGQIVVSNTATTAFAIVAMITATTPVFTTNSSGVSTLSEVVAVTTSTPAFSGAGIFVFFAIGYGSTGTGGSATLNGGAGAIAFQMAPIRFRPSALYGTTQDGILEYNGSNPYFTVGTTRTPIILDNLGVAGGTTLIGDTASGGNLNLSSTSHTTKGKIITDSDVTVHTPLTITPTKLSVTNEFTGQNNSGSDYEVSTINLGDQGFNTSISTKIPNDAWGDGCRMDLCTPIGSNDNTQIPRVSILPFTDSIGMGTTTPNTSAILELSSTSKGFLVSRMNTSERNLISSPASWLIVFDTDIQRLFQYDGTVWFQV